LQTVAQETDHAVPSINQTREEAREHEEELHAEAVHCVNENISREPAIGIAHRPRRQRVLHVRERGVEKNPQQHREPAQRIERVQPMISS
jgi:hypothetical protein